MQPFGYGNHVSEGVAAQEMLKKMVKSNTLTICSSKSPEYYLRLIRYHFIKSSEQPAEKALTIQALGLSS